MGAPGGAEGEQGGPSHEAEHSASAREAELEELPTEELHERAVRRAERHLDVRFLWRLLSEIPAAEALSGDQGEADDDVQHVRGLLSDAFSSGGGQLREALRPLYIDYLSKHPDA